MTQSVLTDFSNRHKELFGRHTVNLGHTFAASPLFTDAALAQLIERAPAGSYHVNTMDVTTHDPRTRREGIVDAPADEAPEELSSAGAVWRRLEPSWPAR